MLPITKSAEKVHRERKRHMEIGIIVEEISEALKNNAEFANKNITILEFGSGDGIQIPYLKCLGKVVATDIYASDEIKRLQDIEFVECGITDMPFEKGQFDIVFSNHVIEHIDDLKSAFQETRRIGAPSCIYAFSVPTNIWLLLSIPAQYYNKVRRLFTLARKRSLTTTSIEMNRNKKDHFPNRRHKAPSIFARVFRFILPTGHGVILNFIECYHCFKIENWQQLLSDNGFAIIKTKPLLLYAPSEWPIIPTQNCDSNLCSSVLFLMKKNP